MTEAPGPAIGSGSKGPGPEGAGPEVLALYAPRWVARRLGVTPATLRSWHHRYDLGPTGRTDGGHRRYSRTDLERLEGICGLVAAGITIGEAARMWNGTGAPVPEVARSATDPGSPTNPAGAAHQITLLTTTAEAMDHVGTARIINEVLLAYGVIAAWTTILMPALQRMGDRFARTADGIHAEHMLSECMRAGLWNAAARCRRDTGTPSVLLAAPNGEQHVLALHAVAAGLAECDQPSVLLGASVPPSALLAAIRELEPSAVFLWSHTRTTARQAGLPALREHPGSPSIILGGPGWPTRLPPQADRRVDTLADAVQACAAAATLTT